MDLYKHLLSYLILLLLGFFSGQTCAGTIKPRPKKALAMAKASNRCPTSILVGKEGTIPIVSPPHLELKAILFGRGQMTYTVDSIFGLRESRSEATLYDLGYVLKASDELHLPRLDIAPEFTQALAVGTIRDWDFKAYSPAWSQPTTKAVFKRDGRPFYFAFRDSSTFISLGPGPNVPDYSLHLAKYLPSDQWPLRPGDSENHLRSMVIRVSVSVRNGPNERFKAPSEVTLPFTAQYWVFGRPSDVWNGAGPLCSNV